MVDNLIKFLEWTDKLPVNKFYRYLKAIIQFIFLPIIVLLEILVYRYIWNLVVKDICSDDELVKFLDDNEFTINRWKFIKKDLITKQNPMFNRQEEEIEFELTRQFSEAVTNIIRRNIISNIEQYISIVSNLKTYNSNIKIYSVSIVYYRINIVYNRFWVFTLLTLIFATIFCILTFGLVTLNF
jgi:hypothetical protein